MRHFCFSEEFAKLAARKYARIVQKLGFEVRLKFLSQKPRKTYVGLVLE